MMLSTIRISSLRNLSSVELSLSPSFNILLGNNGSGKTSFLEAIYLLSLGRSFRTHLNKSLISHEKDQMTVSASIDNSINIGVERNRNGESRIKINNDLCYSAAKLAELLPLQLINPDSYKIVESTSKNRREFLDWGVFHVKPSFFDAWKRGRNILKQRNAALRSGYHQQNIHVWDKALIEVSESLNQMREWYINLFKPIFDEVCKELLNIDIKLKYYPGWNKALPFSEVLDQSFTRDRELGYTQFGPHRADLKLTSNNVPITDVLSRGQFKLLICALKLAQGILLKELTSKSCLYLIDDLASELDQERRIILINSLVQLNAQVFITIVDKSLSLDLYQYSSSKLFHVKHGIISEEKIA